MVAVEAVDLLVVGLDERAQNGQAMIEGIGKLEGVELGGAALTPHVLSNRQDPVLGHHRMGLGLDPGAKVAQLVSESDQLSELANLAVGRSSLGQSTQPQQVGQVPRVPFVVLHPPVSPVVAVGVGQVDDIAVFLEQIDRPIPAVGGLDHHVAAPGGLAHFLGQPDRVIVDSDAVDLFACLVHPIDHRTPAVQVDPTYSLPTGASLLVELRASPVSIVRVELSRGAEAPLLHRITYGAVEGTSCTGSSS